MVRTVSSMNSLLKVTLSACLAAISATSLRCELGTWEWDSDIHDLFAKSDLVVLGSSEKPQVLREWEEPEHGPSSQRSVAMESLSSSVHVEKVYKGKSASSIEIQFDIGVLPSTPNPGPALFRGERALLFLQRGEEGAYRFVQSPGGRLNAQGLSFAGSSIGQDGLEQDLNRSLSGGKVGRESALDILLEYRGLSNNTELTLRRLGTDSDSNTAAKALSILMTTGRPEYFETLSHFLSANGGNVAGREQLMLSGRLREFGNHANPLTISAISGLPLTAIQSAALDVLSEMRSPATVEAVVRLLDDPNPEVQYQSLYVLMKILDEPGKKRGPEYSPTPAEFAGNRAYYTGLWKQWWVADGKARFSRSDGESR
jgi:hypothetical protein